ncbi:MAG: hypothetical protein ACYDEF_09350 [Methanosarcina sp.]
MLTNTKELFTRWLILANWSNIDMKSRIMDIHVVLFFSNELQRPDLLQHSLNFKLNNLFDDVPTILPMPPQAPKEIPSVLLKSVDNKYKCNISRSNIDFSFFPQENVEKFSDIESSFDKTAVDFIKVIDEDNTTSVNRIGFVITYFIPDVDPSAKIVDNFIKKSIGKTDEISIRYNQIEKKNNVTINNVTIIMASELIVNGKKLKGIIIQRDVNNQVSRTNLDSDFLTDFIRQKYKEFSKEELDKVLT